MDTVWKFMEISLKNVLYTGLNWTGFTLSENGDIGDNQATKTCTADNKHQSYKHNIVRKNCMENFNCNTATLIIMSKMNLELC